MIKIRGNWKNYPDIISIQLFNHNKNQFHRLLQKFFVKAVILSLELIHKFRIPIFIWCRPYLRPRPRPRPLPRPIPTDPDAAIGATVALTLSSTKRASRFSESGNIHARIVFPRIDKVEYETGFFPRLSLKFPRWCRRWWIVKKIVRQIPKKVSS